MIIAIDGPAASGKSSTARAVARRLGYAFLSTGAMYRSVALALRRRGRTPTHAALKELLPTLKLDTPLVDGTFRMVIDGEDVTDRLSEPDIAQTASSVATLRVVRRTLVERQRVLGLRYGNSPGLVLEGRDTGTVVFPDADLKIYMWADAEVRAARRHQEFIQCGRDIPYEAILREILARDQQDKDRTDSPLRAADDAVVLDTSHRSRQEQILFILDQVRERMS